MGRVRIVTDSTADIPQELVDELGIIVVPLKVSFGSDIYRDGVDIKPREFIALMEKEKVMPTTSQPSPGEFVSVYENLAAKGDTVVSIHLSGKLSGTVQSAQTAKAMTGARDVYIIDSKTASMGLGLIVLAAAKAAKEGQPIREVMSVIKYKMARTFVIFLVDTLEYLEKGGRIGKASAFLGTMLKIKPILTVDAGQVIPLEKVRGKAAAIDRIAQIVTDRTDISKHYVCSFVYGNDYEAMTSLKEKVLPVFNCENLIVTEIGPVIMSHTGPGLVGVVLCRA
ncbi:MAG: DegV family protein [Eubacteriales bacterium]